MFKLLSWVASSLQSRETNVADFACVWDRNFSTKIKAKISNEYSLNNATNIRLRFYAVFHSPNDDDTCISSIMNSSYNMLDFVLPPNKLLCFTKKSSIIVFVH